MVSNKKIKAKIFFIVIVAFTAFISVVKADELKSTVLANPYNTLAAQLENKGLELNNRELALQALETRLEKSYVSVLLMVVFLFLLIVVNYLLDFRRRKKMTLTK